MKAKIYLQKNKVEVEIILTGKIVSMIKKFPDIVSAESYYRELKSSHHRKDYQPILKEKISPVPKKKRVQKYRRIFRRYQVSLNNSENQE